MSMSTHVVGFKPPDEKWKQMKHEACQAAKIPVPAEVDAFFGGEAESVPDFITDLVANYFALILLAAVFILGCAR